MGIAYESKVAGVRILSGAISDVDEAASLNFGYQNASIYSCSWGPPDDGRSMEGPNYLVKKAMANGITRGRGGLGSVFVFASGNGGRNGDQCNFDGYTNSIFSITVAAVDYKGAHPPYSEACAANMVVASSSGSGNHIVSFLPGLNIHRTSLTPISVDHDRRRKEQMCAFPWRHLCSRAKRRWCFRTRA